MRISKVYTRTGDGGETALVGGRRISKADARVEAYGDVDELNSLLGLARAHLRGRVIANEAGSPVGSKDDNKVDNNVDNNRDDEVDEALSRLQNDLFTVGADLASPADVEVPRLNDEFITALEELSDKFLTQLAPLTEFILPGGSVTGATLHLARTVARRAERRVVALQSLEEINPQTIRYLNRLSDLLFILARVANKRHACPETLADFSKRKQRVTSDE